MLLQPGSHPREFRPRGSDRVQPGTIGQYVLRHQQFGISGDPRSNDRFRWPVDKILSTCKLDVAAIDPVDSGVLTPAQGELFDITGSPNFDEPTPWYITVAEWMKCMEFCPDCYMIAQDSIVVNPAHDYVYIVLTRPSGISTPNRRILSSLSGSGGIDLYYDYTSAVIVARVNGATTFAFNSASLKFGAWHLIGCVGNVDGTQRLYINEDKIDEDDMSGIGTLASSHKFAVGSTNTGVGKDGYHDHSRAMFFSGEGIADLLPDSWWENLARYVLSYANSQADYDATFTRTTVASEQRSDKTFHFLNGMPSVANKRYRAEGSRTNTCFRNHHILSGHETLWNTTGAMPVSVVSILSERGPVREFGLNAYKIGPNTTGSTQHAWMGNSSGNTNKRCVSCRGYDDNDGARNCKVGLYDTSGPSFVSADTISSLTGHLEDRHVGLVTPPSNSSYFGIEVPDGAYVIVILQHSTEAEVIETEIPNLATAASATRNQDICNYASFPYNEKGRLEVVIKTENWSGTNPLGYDASFIGNTTPTPITAFYIPVASNQSTFTDRTNSATIADGFTGNEQDVRCSWGRGGIELEIDGDVDTDSFDGNTNIADGWGFGVRSGQSPYASCRDLKLLRSE